MSTYEEALTGTASSGDRAQLDRWFLWRPTLTGQIRGSVGLAFLSTAFGILGVTSSTSSHILRLYTPWAVTDAWSLAATAGWGVVVSTLIGGSVRSALTKRTGRQPALGWCTVGVAIGGYGAALIATSSGAQFVFAVVATPFLVRVLAYDRSGSTRTFPLRRPALILATATVVIFPVPYGLLHGFAVDDQDPSTSIETPYPSAWETRTNNRTIYGVNLGEAVPGRVNLSGGRLGVTLTGLRVETSGSVIRATAINVSDANADSGASPGAGLPLRLAGGWSQELVVTYKITLVRCDRESAGVSAVRLDYRLHGIALSQTVPLDSPPALGCNAYPYG